MMLRYGKKKAEQNKMIMSMLLRGRKLKDNAW